MLWWHSPSHFLIYTLRCDTGRPRLFSDGLDQSCAMFIKAIQHTAVFPIARKLTFLFRSMLCHLAGIRGLTHDHWGILANISNTPFPLKNYFKDLTEELFTSLFTLADPSIDLLGINGTLRCVVGNWFFFSTVKLCALRRHEQTSRLWKK